ncbi:MAG TPA: peptide-methionine (R)-S-oxide reductase MsrB [Candidatus Saccharimonadales bacterium]|nr:peptide-methionine (R)-S-oxide reductase MsrB [Candidatus Saccharimonadales bacterium]
MARQLDDERLRKKLTPEQYRVLRGKGTEAPFTGKFLHSKESGMYTCAACGAELFPSGTKFDSGTGWPSFYDVTTKGAVELEEDRSHGMARTEATCANCGSHLGHLFDDAYGQPTGQRYCINSCALDFFSTESKKK